MANVIRRQQAGFQNDLDQCLPGSRLHHGGNIGLHRRPIAVFCKPDVHHHVQLIGAVLHRIPCRKSLGGGCVGSQREADDRADLDRSTSQRRFGVSDASRVDAYRKKIMLTCLVA